MQNRLPSLLSTTLLCLMAASAMASDTDASGAMPSATRSGTEIFWELDPYYSNISLQLPLTAQAVSDGGTLSEAEVYQQLFRESLRPRLFMLEASVYPLPAAGTWLKRKHPDSYDNFEIGEVGGNHLNIIDGITAGFQEPWAVSAFIGSAMRFNRSDGKGGDSNRGYMGYLLSYGAKHIHNNVLIDDDWWELEWKLKGERHQDEEQLSWSFRLGVREHGNRDIRDVAYVGLRRNNISYRSSLLQLLNNTNLELLTELNRRGLGFLRQEVTLGRNFPLRNHRFALTLDLGFIYESEDKYSGALADPTADNFTVIFRPNVKF